MPVMSIERSEDATAVAATAGFTDPLTAIPAATLPNCNAKSRLVLVVMGALSYITTMSIDWPGVTAATGCSTDAQRCYGVSS
jgi:hypothetical protein